ncbi:MAG: CpsD/CapB family tyrosine-protein kinase, partial [Phycisphaerales bacterium]|nr:CpsD/CapB family tyrosine-protein kinase [Phycisphaerales bacterium]
PNSVVAESFRQANAQVMREMTAGGHVVLLVVGGLPGSGTTSVVANLGATDAAAGKRVLLIDANFRRPRLPEAIGVAEDGPGLGDLLCGEGTLEDVLVDVGDGLHLLHAGTPSSRVLERLNSPKLDSVLAELRPRYDVILIDAPPAVVAGEAMVLASKADAALLVVRANQEQRGLVARLVRQLSDMRCQLVGILLNRPRGTAGGYLKKNYAAMAEYAKST